MAPIPGLAQRPPDRWAEVKRPCLTCGVPTQGSYCSAHTKRKHDGLTTTQRGLGHAYRKVAAQVLAQEHTCWLCGMPPTATDPLTVDHVIPRAKGGTHQRSNLRAAHSSCNSKRGARSVKGVDLAHDQPDRFAV